MNKTTAGLIFVIVSLFLLLQGTSSLLDGYNNGTEKMHANFLSLIEKQAYESDAPRLPVTSLKEATVSLFGMTAPGLSIHSEAGEFMATLSSLNGSLSEVVAKHELGDISSHLVYPLESNNGKPLDNVAALCLTPSGASTSCHPVYLRKSKFIAVEENEPQNSGT